MPHAASSRSLVQQFACVPVLRLLAGAGSGLAQAVASPPSPAPTEFAAVARSPRHRRKLLEAAARPAVQEPRNRAFRIIIKQDRNDPPVSLGVVHVVVKETFLPSRLPSLLPAGRDLRCGTDAPRYIRKARSRSLRGWSARCTSAGQSTISSPWNWSRTRRRYRWLAARWAKASTRALCSGESWL